MQGGGSVWAQKASDHICHQTNPGRTVWNSWLCYNSFCFHVGICYGNNCRNACLSHLQKSLIYWLFVTFMNLRSSPFSQFEEYHRRMMGLWDSTFMVFPLFMICYISLLMGEWILAEILVLYGSQICQELWEEGYAFLSLVWELPVLASCIAHCCSRHTMLLLTPGFSLHLP